MFLTKLRYFLKGGLLRIFFVIFWPCVPVRDRWAINLMRLLMSMTFMIIIMNMI